MTFAGFKTMGPGCVCCLAFQDDFDRANETIADNGSDADDSTGNWHGETNANQTVAIDTNRMRLSKSTAASIGPTLQSTFVVPYGIIYEFRVQFPANGEMLISYL